MPETEFNTIRCGGAAYWLRSRRGVLDRKRLYIRAFELASSGQHIDCITIVSALAAEGFTVATLETWKTFFFPSKPRGKFAGKPILHPEMLTRRYSFVPVYVTIWIAVVACATMALVSPASTLFAASGY